MKIDEIETFDDLIKLIKEYNPNYLYFKIVGGVFLIGVIVSFITRPGAHTLSAFIIYLICRVGARVEEALYGKTKEEMKLRKEERN